MKPINILKAVLLATILGFSLLSSAQITLPFTEGFNSDSPTQANWTIVDANPDGNNWTTNNTANVYEGDECAIISSWGSGTEDDYLISPQITLTGNDRLIFHNRVGSSSYPSSLEIVLSTTTNDIASFTETILSNTQFDNYGWEETIVDLSAYSGNVYIAFHLDGAAGFSFSIDEVIFETIASCELPTNLSVSSIDQTSANLSWISTASSFNIEWGNEGFIQGSGTTIPGTTNPYLLTSLNPGTTYNYWVQADCSGDLSSWAGPFEFTTLCEIITPDYLENFNSSVNIPDCWNENQGTITGANGTDGLSDWIFEYDDATVNINNLNGDNEWLISPSFNLSLGYELNFDITIDSDYDNAMGADDQVQLLYTINNGVSWTNLQTWTESDYLLSQNYTIDLSGVTDLEVRFAFWASNGEVMDGNDVYFSVDNFTVRTPSSCVAPTDLLVSNITNSSVDFTWTEMGTAAAWDIAILEEGESFSGIPTYGNITNNPFNITTLASNTTYDLYIRSICEAGGYSDWVNIIFTTECDIISSYPFTEDFEGDFLPQCWSKYLPDSDVANDISQSYEVNHTDNGLYSAQFSSFNESQSDPAEYNQYLITPTFDINQYDLELSFWTSKGVYYDEAEELYLGIATANDTTWTSINIGAEEWLKETVDLSIYYNESIFFIFRYYGDYLYYVYLDDIRVGTAIVENTEAEILTYSIPNQLDSYVSSSNDSIHVSMPQGTSISNLIADFTLSENAEATIYSVEQISGTTPNNWSSMNPIPYTVTAENGTERTWSVYVDVATGINTVYKNEVAIYPNPTTGVFNVLINNYLDFNKIFVINNKGQVIQEVEIDNGSELIDLSKQAKGIYYIKIISNSYSRHLKVVVK